MNANKLCSTFAVLIGLFFIVDGVWGMFSPVTFGVFSTNTTHSIIHILLGLGGLYYGSKGTARYYCSLVGIIILTVGILFFIDGASHLTIEYFNLNAAVAYFNIIAGSLALVFALAARPERVQ